MKIRTALKKLGTSKKNKDMLDFWHIVLTVNRRPEFPEEYRFLKWYE